MTKIKVGIIGYGNWVKNSYIPAITYDGRADIIAISAKSDATIKTIKNQFGDSVTVYNDYRDLLHSDHIDAVMIAVPDAMHGEIIIAAIQSGLPFFYEPPIGHTRTLINQVLEKLQTAPQITHADLELGLIPAISKAATLIKTKQIGNIQSVCISLRSNWGTAPDQDTNVINRLSLWYIHVLNILLDAYPNRVLLLDGHGLNGRRQRQSSCILDYDGVWGQLKVNIDSVDTLDIKVEATGDKGEILIDILTGELTTRLKNSGQTKFYPSKQPYADWPGMRESVSYFFDAIENDTSSFANANLVKELQAIGMATEESKDTGTWAKVIYTR
ncbi:Gfo/Idh/MocA family oxidoreductase [Aquimarina sp. 2201CG5-10]|uniref:Gfo/Idh/MocA family protein n=1 Tax=Aquimarina callyspongiae TaxID=3098150 RepID=UPI002AB59EB8|nr:Gfo/Idh/MocA family oxidoreductase [Aquimarina sp. 2201CG5-10]MDY8137206.1 Gfo/Idh/MocA family oxidoreductase [Aquimarina sp. 2201CG5-10]